jgi:hypothetical protein
MLHTYLLFCHGHVPLSQSGLKPPYQEARRGGRKPERGSCHHYSGRNTVARCRSRIFPWRRGIHLKIVFFLIEESIPLYALGSITVTNAYSQSNSLTSSKFWNRSQTSVSWIIVNLIFIFFC